MLSLWWRSARCGYHRFHRDAQYHARRVILEKVKPSTSRMQNHANRAMRFAGSRQYRKASELVTKVLSKRRSTADSSKC